MQREKVLTATTTTRQTRQKTARRATLSLPFTAEQWQELRQAVERLHGDRKLPFNWSIRNDLSIVKQMAKRYDFADMLAMVEGLAILRDKGEVSWIHPREAVTLRALRKMSGVERVEHKALAAGYQSRAAKPQPVPRGTTRAPQSIANVLASLPRPA